MSTKSKLQHGLRDLEKRLGKATVGEFLRAWRLAEEISQREFARKLKISPANLCDIERGRKGVSPEKAEEIAHTLGYSSTVLVRMALTEQLESAGLKYVIEVKSAV